jgi:Asp-tRNA(Asn)/Glu-tRNA(Gln) amidotransferase A subunit family amidase
MYRNAVSEDKNGGYSQRGLVRPQLGAERAVRGDAPAVAELRAAGAVLLGKANLHEVGVGMTGLNLAHGTARNPHDAARFCGGSSSGCAAAVAAGVCTFALGARLPPQ